MSDWLGVLERRRQELGAENAEDGMPAPTAEYVLAQVIYEAITDFIERDAYAVVNRLCEDPDYELDPDALAFVDATGEAIG